MTPVQLQGMLGDVGGHIESLLSTSVLVTVPWLSHALSQVPLKSLPGVEAMAPALREMPALFWGIPTPHSSELSGRIDKHHRRAEAIFLIGGSDYLSRTWEGVKQKEHFQEDVIHVLSVF